MGVKQSEVAAVSVFTTQSVTAMLEKIRDQIKAGTPEPADFLLGPGGTRTMFPLSNVTGITVNRQVSTAPTFSASPVPLGFLELFPGTVSQLAFGKYLSPDYETAEQVIPPIGTLSGTPALRQYREQMRSSSTSSCRQAFNPPMGGRSPSSAMARLAVKKVLRSVSPPR
jgi:hypothetical protein